VGKIMKIDQLEDVLSFVNQWSQDLYEELSKNITGIQLDLNTVMTFLIADA
jgi:ABC-type nickel/cobalt efflux system permease component RcnA